MARRIRSSLPKAARDALHRMHVARYHNATDATLAILVGAGLAVLGGPHGARLTSAGTARAAKAAEHAIKHYHRTRHVGGSDVKK